MDQILILYEVDNVSRLKVSVPKVGGFYAYVFVLSFLAIHLHSFVCVLERIIKRSRHCCKVVPREDTRVALVRSRVWDIMKKTQDRLIKSIRSQNFKKYISVAHKDNGEDFFYEVCLLSSILFGSDFPLQFLLVLYLLTLACVTN